MIGTQIVLGSIPSEYDKLRLNNPYYTGDHDPNINPIYAANNEKDKSELLSKKDMYELLDKNQKKMKTKKIKSVELKTYKEHILEDDPSDYSYAYNIAEDRMVWVVITEYPEGLNTKRGYYDKATTINVFDAETGDLLKSKVNGDLKKSYKP